MHRQPGPILQLYHHGSSTCSAKVRLALAEKNLPWQGHYIDILAGEQFRPEYLAINPRAVVPVLIHERAVIPESTVICEYLDEAFPESPLFPSAPLQRAAVRQWTKAVDEELHPACSAITYVVSHRHTILRQGSLGFEEFMQRGAADGSDARALKWQWIQHGFEAPGAADRIRLYDAYLHKMEDALRSAEWLAGERFSMADAALAPYVNRLAALSMERLWTGGRLKGVEAWFARVRSRPTFKPALVDWVPAELAAEMHANGVKSWSSVAAIVGM